MIVYVDVENKCHTINNGTMQEKEDSFFDGKCPAFIEGYKLEDTEGIRHIFPFVDSDVLQAYQAQYEAMLPEMTDMQTALETLGVNING